MTALHVSVLKFGSSVLGSRRDLRLSVHEIYRELREGRRVIAVVSALGRSTDRLLREGRRLGAHADSEALALLAATGETRATALLTLALQRAGISARALDSAQIGLITRGPLADAEPCELDVQRIRRALEETSVIVVPGFVGRDGDGRTTLLGRGGSDLSALFIAQRLGAATCRLLKDVAGVYERDPALDGPPPKRFESLSWSDSLGVGGAIVQAKALRFAATHRTAFEVARVGARVCTRIGREPSRFAAGRDAPRRLRVALLGLGTVGLGVYRELSRYPERFDVGCVLVRDRFKRRGSPVPLECVTSDPRVALASDCDVFVELLGGTQTADDMAAAALASGRDVVTANKALVVERGAEFLALAADSGARFRFSATVGGALPVLETVRRIARERGVAAFESILNSTTNFVLGRLEQGDDLETAVGRARQRGFCEADPRLDLDGTDAAHKLELTAREAFGSSCELHWLERRGLEGLAPAHVREVHAAGGAVRLVASCRRTSERIEARLAPREVPAESLFARTHGEENALWLETASGEHIALRGKGAGRWPTTEAVLGDLLELSREERASPRIAPAIEEVAR